MNFPSNSFPGGLFLPSAGFIWFAFAVLAAIIHIMFALGVLADSQFLQRHFRRGTFLVGGVLWALATLLGGVFVAAIYWLIHHSTLRPQHLLDAPKQDPPSPQSQPKPLNPEDY